MPFVILENSSGTGKTQMAFNLEAHGAFDVFYIPCTPTKDMGQEVYRAFNSRQIAFEDCMTSDIKDMEGDGSVVEFGKDANKRLKVYAFIIAALDGANTFMGDALLQDVIAVRDRRARDPRIKPIVFFLDEFPRVEGENNKLLQSMRNVFRFLCLPLIISSTNDTARSLFTVSGYSRPSSGNPVPWCMVVPSLPTFAIEESDPTSVFGWIIQRSRPLFGALALQHMDEFPYDGQDQLKYLTDMVIALASTFRGLKGTKRANEFKNGQLYLFLGASYNADEELTILSGENDEKYIPVDDDAENSDEEMLEAASGSDENSKKEVNLIEGHYGRMEEQESFELQFGIRNLKKDKKYWKCRYIFPRLKDDILLYLTLMGDYEDTRAPCNSILQRELGLPNIVIVRSPLDRPFYKKLRDVLGKSGATLEALVAGAVVLASHQGGFYGVNFKAFLGRLLYELGVRDFNKPVKFPAEHTEMKNFTIPFLSPPSVAWPNEFLAFWKDTRAQFGSMRRSRNSDRMEIQTHSGVLSAECKDREKFTLSVLKYVLQAIPPASKIHLVVVKRLKGEYFPKVPFESVAEPKSESASAFLERIGLQDAKFYRTLRRAKGRLEEFPELMQARRDLPRDEKTNCSTGCSNMEINGGAGKTIIFVEVGNWK